jgi:hypothetical protein
MLPCPVKRAGELYNEPMKEDIETEEGIDQLAVHDEIDALELPEPEKEEVEVWRGDLLPPFRKGKKAPYRSLTIPERDMLFAFYEKWSGNMLAITRDPECPHKAYNAIKYWSNLYNFPSRLVQIRTERAKETMAGLADSKLEAIRRAVEMVQPRQVALRDKDKNVILMDGAPVFETVYPDQKTLKTAWEIIKTELGEPTWIAKSEVNTPLHDEVREALDLISQLTKHGGARDNSSDVQGERSTAGDTTPVSPAVQHDPNAQSPAQ